MKIRKFTKINKNTSQLLLPYTFTTRIRQNSIMSFRYNLQRYIDNPDHSLVVFKNNLCVVIKDKFPKSVCHYLVLPTDEAITLVHPLVALKDAELRHKLTCGVEAAIELVIEEFVNKGFVENVDEARNHFRESFVKTGIHSIPSMANLHIHVLSKDMYLPFMKHKKHYNSFNSEFFVELATFEMKSDQNDDTSDSSCSTSSLGSDEEVNDQVMSENRTNFENGTNFENDISSEKRTMSDRERNSIGGIMSQKSPGILFRGPESFKGKKQEHLKQYYQMNEKRVQSLLNKPLECFYCGKIFGTKFSLLKEHLEEEFKRQFHSTIE